MTPAYLYIAFFSYIIFRLRRKKFEPSDLAIVVVGLYGLVMYNTAFRAIWASQFEMALQPEKITLFYLLEEGFFYLTAKRKEILAGRGMFLSDERKKVLFMKGRLYLLNFFIFAFIASSLGYTIQRYNNRFYMYKFVKNRLLGKDIEPLKPLFDQATKQMNIPRVGPMTVPVRQWEDFEQLNKFIQMYTREDEPVFMFPELGTYSFAVNRSFVGRFPMVPFSWFKEDWHKEFVAELKRTRPSYAIVAKDPGNWFPEVYFKIKRNKEMYDEVSEFIRQNYIPIEQTPTLLIYQLNLDGNKL